MHRKIWHIRLFKSRLQQKTTTHLVAALCSDVWQKRKRSSFKPLVKAYLVRAIARKVRGSGSIDKMLLQQKIISVPRGNRGKDAMLSRGMA